MSASVSRWRRRARITTAISPPATAPQIDSPPFQISNAPAIPPSLQLVSGEQVIDARADHASDDDGHRELGDDLRVVAGPAPTDHRRSWLRPARRSRASARTRGAGADRCVRSRAQGSGYTPPIIGRDPRAVQGLAACGRWSAHARNSLVVARRARNVVARGRAAFAAPPLSAGAAAGGGGVRRSTAGSEASAAARCSRRQRVEHEGRRRCRCAPTRRRSSATSARPVDARCCTPTSAAAARTASRSRSCPSTQPKVPIHYTAYGDESDPGPFPIPANAPVEGGAASDGDRHVLVLQQGTCHLFELGRRVLARDHWDADVGVNWNLDRTRCGRGLDVGRRRRPPDPRRARALRRGCSAGTSITRCASPCRSTQKGYILPATHYASSSTIAALPPMGLRLRLKASYDAVAVPRAVARDPEGAEEVRDDRRRQRLDRGSSPARPTRVGTTTT